MSQRSRDKNRGWSPPFLIVVFYRMDQPGLSSRSLDHETPQSRTESEASVNSLTIHFPGVGVEIPLGIGLESSSKDEYEEPSLEEKNDNALAIMTSLSTIMPQLISDMMNVMLEIRSPLYILVAVFSYWKGGWPLFRNNGSVLASWSQSRPFQKD